MRICHVILTPRHSGAEMVVGHLATRHQAEGYQVAVAALNPCDPDFASVVQGWKDKGVELHFPKAIPSGRLAKLTGRVDGLKGAFRSFGPDVVFAHSIIPSGYVRLAKRGLAKTPKVVTVLHSATEDDYAERTGLVTEKLMPKPDAVVAVTKKGAENYRARFSPQFPVEVIPNGMDIAAIQGAVGARTSAREELQVKPGDQLLLQVGRISSTKRQLESVRALQVLLKRGLPVRLALAGIFEDADYLAELKSIIAGEGLADRVHLLGSREDVPRLLSACDTLLMPSRIEAHSVAFLEGLAANKPVVASDIQPFAFAHRYPAAWFVDPGQIEAYADAIATALEAPPVVRDLDEFSVQRMCDRYADLASRLLGGAKRA